MSENAIPSAPQANSTVAAAKAKRQHKAQAVATIPLAPVPGTPAVVPAPAAPAESTPEAMAAERAARAAALSKSMEEYKASGTDIALDWAEYDRSVKSWNIRIGEKCYRHICLGTRCVGLKEAKVKSDLADLVTAATGEDHATDIYRCVQTWFAASVLGREDFARLPITGQKAFASCTERYDVDGDWGYALKPDMADKVKVMFQYAIGLPLPAHLKALEEHRSNAGMMRGDDVAELLKAVKDGKNPLAPPPAPEPGAAKPAVTTGELPPATPAGEDKPSCPEGVTAEAYALLQEVPLYQDANPAVRALLEADIVLATGELGLSTEEYLEALTEWGEEADVASYLTENGVDAAVVAAAVAGKPTEDKPKEQTATGKRDKEQVFGLDHKPALAAAQLLKALLEHPERGMVLHMLGAQPEWTMEHTLAIAAGQVDAAKPGTLDTLRKLGAWAGREVQIELYRERNSCNRADAVLAIDSKGK